MSTNSINKKKDLFEDISLISVSSIKNLNKKNYKDNNNLLNKKRNVNNNCLELNENETCFYNNKSNSISQKKIFNSNCLNYINLNNYSKEANCTKLTNYTNESDVNINKKEIVKSYNNSKCNSNKIALNQSFTINSNSSLNFGEITNDISIIKNSMLLLANEIINLRSIVLSSHNIDKNMLNNLSILYSNKNILDNYIKNSTNNEGVNNKNLYEDNNMSSNNNMQKFVPMSNSQDYSNTKFKNIQDNVYNDLSKDDFSSNNLNIINNNIQLNNYFNSYTNNKLSISSICNIKYSDFYVVGIKDGTIELRFKKSHRIAYARKGHDMLVKTITDFDSKTIISGGTDNKVKVWKIVEPIIEDENLKKLTINITKENWNINDEKLTNLNKKNNKHNPNNISVNYNYIEENNISEYSKFVKSKGYICYKLELVFTFEGHIGTINCLLKIDPCCVVSGSYDSSIKIWDVYKGKEVGLLGKHQRHRSVNGFIQIGYKENNLNFIFNDFSGNNLVLQSNENNKFNRLNKLKNKNSINFDELSILISIGTDKAIRYWDIEGLQEIKEKRINEKEYLYSIIKLDDKYMAVGGSSSIIIYNYILNKKIASITHNLNSALSICLLNYPYIICGHENQKVTICNWKHHKIEAIQKTECSSNLAIINFSNDIYRDVVENKIDEILIGGSIHNKLSLWVVTYE